MLLTGSPIMPPWADAAASSIALTTTMYLITWLVLIDCRVFSESRNEQRHTEPRKDERIRAGFRGARRRSVDLELERCRWHRSQPGAAASGVLVVEAGRARGAASCPDYVRT